MLVSLRQLFIIFESYVVALVDIEISIHISLVRAPHSAGHAWERLLDGENAFNIIALEFFARDGVDNGGLDTEEGQGSTTRFRRGDSCERGDDVGASFRLPVGLL